MTKRKILFLCAIAHLLFLTVYLIVRVVQIFNFDYTNLDSFGILFWKGFYKNVIVTLAVGVINALQLVFSLYVGFLKLVSEKYKKLRIVLLCFSMATTVFYYLDCVIICMFINAYHGNETTAYILIGILMGIFLLLELFCILFSIICWFKARNNCTQRSANVEHT